MRVGFVGLGHMGVPMTARLVAAGHEVRGFDADPTARARAGAAAVGSLAEAAAGVEAVVLMLASSAIVRQVVLDEGLLDAVEGGSLVADMGSSDPTQTRELAGEAERRGVRYIDAPVSGGVVGAEAGTLTIMAGGSEADLDTCRPVFEAVGQKVVHAGPVGAGHALKALNNLLSATNFLITLEAVAAGARFGLDPKVMVDAINDSTGRSWATEHKVPQFVEPRSFTSGFAMRLMIKDIQTAKALAHASGSPFALGDASVALWEQAADALPDEADHTEIARWLETV
ncbi:MAG: NAD(P)-dependent oxidoreductase [Verrucomicrobiota bacterium]